MRFTKLLGFKLFLIIAGVMLSGTFIFSAVTVNWHTRQYMKTATQNVARVSDVIQRSMHYSMLLNRREDIEHIIRTVGNEPGIEAVRIYNKKGEMTFSSNQDDIGKAVSFADNACSACHATGATPVTPGSSDLTRIFHSTERHRIIGKITPIKNEPSCATAACHAHPELQTVLGVLDVTMPLHEFDESLGELERSQYTNAFVLAATVTAFAGMFIWLMVNKPVRKLMLGTEQVRAGNLEYRINLNTNDEIGSLAQSFNSMTENLLRAHRELKQWTFTLEQRVREKTEELRRAHVNMIQVEKMVSLGTLAATVAHELNNPLEGILTYAKVLKRKVAETPVSPELKIELEGELTIIADETARCGNIVKNLLLFSRQKVGEFREADIAAVLSRSVNLIDHLMKINNIRCETRFTTSERTLIADPDQLEQAFLAITINAVEAMPGDGVLRIEVGTANKDDAFVIEISDTGVGIREEDIPHIFEPFYTTKQDGKGTGLGLAVAYGIMERHNGSIKVRSNINRGTTFTITLPRRQAEQDTPSILTSTITV